MAENQAELRVKLLRYRDLMRQTTDPAVRAALQELLRMISEKLNGHDAAS